jgi:hypothetical protein
MLLGRSVLFEVIEVGGPDRLHGGGLVSAVVRDGFGLEQRLELPAAIGARPGTLLRIDRVNAQTIAATNLSARGRLTRLADAADWFPAERIGLFSAFACALGAALLLQFSGPFQLSATSGISIGLALMAPACLTLLRGARAARCRSQARTYMQMVCSDRAQPLPNPRLRDRASVPLVARGEALA